MAMAGPDLNDVTYDAFLATVVPCRIRTWSAPCPS